MNAHVAADEHPVGRLARNGDAVVGNPGQSPPVDVLPCDPAVPGAKNAVVVEVGNRGVDEIGIRRTRLQTGNLTPRHQRPREVAAPGIATIGAAENAAVVGAHVDGLGIGARHFDRRDVAAVQHR